MGIDRCASALTGYPVYFGTVEWDNARGVFTLSQKQEAERLRNFLTHCLSIDYGCETPTELSEADRKIYLTHQDYISYRVRTCDIVDRSGPDSYQPEFQAWLRKYARVPSQILRLPSRMSESILHRFVVHQSSLGSYTGCLQTVLEKRGVSHLAEKLWMDRNFMLPRLSTPSRTLESIYSRIPCSVSDIFVHLDGVLCHCEGKTPPTVTVSDKVQEPLKNGFTEHVKACSDIAPPNAEPFVVINGKISEPLNYTLTEHGEACKAALPAYAGHRFMVDRSLQDGTLEPPSSPVQALKGCFTWLQAQCMDWLASWQNQSPSEGKIRI
ncbi:hypothetical protein B0A48_07673 [Cryoendolithus antarcticus]|uniref:Uncharacterized protein n=1 Tax=Cryoendolithus antarcticus TaxID=1507870 RepID=A0A1V8T6R6_9PEZI|nr:hypothetical protein B0A48_07673 [Cryoendolithus antarcticus]